MGLEELKERVVQTYESFNERIPHFPILVGAACLIILIIFGMFFFSGASLGEQEITITAENAAGVGVRGAQVTVTGLGEALSLLTDKDGKAAFNAPDGKDLNVTVSKENYETQAGSIRAKKNAQLKFVLKAPEFVLKEVLFTFVGPDLKKLVGKEVNAKLECTGEGLFGQQDYTVTEGELKVSPPEKCGRIIVTADSTGFLTANQTVLGREQVIEFQGIEKPKGGIDVSVKDSETSRFLDNMNVEILDGSGLPTGIAAQTSFGEASFTGIEVGTYTILITDPGGQYGDESISAEVPEGASVRKEALLSKDIKLKAKIRVKAGTENVEGASVTLYSADGKVSGRRETDAAGIALFNVKEHGTYSYEAGKDGYLPSDRNNFATTSFPKGSEKEFSAALKECTPAICGVLNVRVIDENALAVENARVVLLNEEGFVQSAYGAKATDFNGNAQPFTNVAKGKYIILAQKFPAEAKSAILDIDSSRANSAEVRIFIGTGNVLVKALDADAKPIEFSQADIYAENGRSIGRIALGPGGEGSLVVKADKKVFAIITKQGYEQYVTAAKQVLPGRTLTLSGNLEQQIPGNRPSIEFLGLFSDAGTKAISLKAGQTYTAKFLLRVPTLQNFSRTGVFVRMGDKPSVENENLWIDETSAPLSLAQRGATYTPPKGNAQGIEDATNGNAKWVSFEWESPQPGKYEVQALVKVRNGTTKGTLLPVYYRAWGVAGTNYSRDPFDAVLGDAENNSTRRALYAETHLKSFLEGIDELCLEQFCFSSRLLDVNAGVYVPEPYKVKTFSPYTLEFSITNNSETIHDNANLSIINTRLTGTTAKEVSIESYSLENADARSFSSGTAAFEMPPLALGNFRQNKSISGSLNIEAKSASASSLEFKIVSNQNIALDRFVPLTPFSEEDLNLSVLPEALVALIPIDLNVTAKYGAGDKKGFGINGARVVVKKIAPDLSETTYTGTTNSNGIAKIRVPASSPGTKIVITAQKAGLGIKTVEREIGPQVAQFLPEALKATLNRGTGEEARAELGMLNLIDREIKITKLSVSGSARGLLEEQKMNNFLQQFVGQGIGKNELRSIQVLSAIGSEASFLTKPATIKSTVIAELSLKDEPSVKWVARIPLETLINLAELPANAPCISVSAKDWEDSTLGGTSAIDFEVQNNCVSKQGEEVSLSDLQGKIDWHGSDGIVGNVELAITDPSTGQVSSELLQNGLWSRLNEKLEFGLVYPARLTFVPKEGSLGKKAEFDVGIDAQLETNSGKQFVGSTGDISGAIIVANLDQCVKITPSPDEGLLIDRGSESEDFTIDTKDCGPVSMDIRFCGGGNGFCSGGASEGGINVRPWQFFNVKGGSRNVKVERQGIPGFYGISVEARPKGGSWKKITEIDTVVKPEKGLYFELDKYNFTLIGKGTKDATKVTNEMLLESVSVTASACDWKEASERSNSIGFPPIDFVLGILSDLFQSDRCKKLITRPLKDYVVNLAGTPDTNNEAGIPPDAISVKVSDPRVKGDWNIDILDNFNAKGTHGKQQVGIIFENLNAEQDNPIYAVVTATSKEHNHGDPTHMNAQTRCGAGFHEFLLNPGTCLQAHDTTYSQKFHVKFKVSEEQHVIPPVNFDTYSCESGIEIGRTGKGALPKVKFDWKWSGIAANQCDASNDNYVYCDAAQFTIELNKKLNALYGFLQANNFSLGCPLARDPGAPEQPPAELLQGTVNNTVADLQLGIKQLKAENASGKIKNTVTVRNNTGASQDATVKIDVLTFSGFTDTCTIQLAGIPAGADRNGSCEANTNSDGFYRSSAKITSSTATDSTDSASIETGLYVGSATNDPSQNNCNLKSTEVYYQVPHILRFVEGKPSINWTSEVPDKDSLASLLVFDAYLTKDNYSKEFFNDFSKHYTQAVFEDTGSYFKSLAQDSAGKSYGLNRLIDSGKLSLRGKYSEGSAVSTPGKYGVELVVKFGEGDWRMFTGDGKAKANVSVVVYRKDDPFPGSPFYSLPFDGLVGFEGNAYKRLNYGVSYSIDSGSPVAVSEGATPAKTFPSTGSVATAAVKVRSDRSFYSLSTSPSTRGMLLKVENLAGNKANLTFQPSHATPVMVKYTQEGLSSEPFSAYYSVLENGNPVKTGSSLAYWDGAGNCLDYTGIPVTEAFYQRPDRQGKEADRILDWQNVYSVDWASAVKKGDVYLRTILYSDPEKDVTLKASQGSKATFYTADQQGDLVGLSGVAQMPYNNFSSGSSGKIDSIADAFAMVENGAACITNTGSTTKFWWNPKAVYEAAGTQRSVSTQTKALKAGVSCIG